MKQSRSSKRDHEQWYKINRIKDASRKMPPTLKHRPALTFGILGTVYGISPEGEVKYFDYDWLGALRFAGVVDRSGKILEGIDLRRGPATRRVELPGYDMWYPERRVPKGRFAWWVLK
jgi:hypothetical protein